MRPQLGMAGFLTSTLVLTLALGMAACTKELPYQTKYKEAVLGKDQIDPNAEYLYVASYQDMSRSSADLMPYFQGEEKIVKLRFTEKALQAIEMDKDERFTDNPNNNKPVFEIPVAHLDFRCARDRAGECTNQEEENTEVVWSAKTLFKPDFEKVDIKEISILPVEMEEALGTNCYSPVGQRYLDHTITKESIDFRIERLFKVNLKCAERVESLSDASISVVYHYSLKKLSTLASEGFKPIEYPEKDERTFGFFSTKENKLDVDNRKMEKNKRVLMNRWDPSRKEIVYHLSSEFSKPENASLRAATFEGFERFNKGLAASGVPFRLVLKDSAGERAGEISNNMIVMVEDPMESGVLGYGPTVTNPRTGEILSGRVIMFPGVMKSFLVETYEELRSEDLKAPSGSVEPKRVSLVERPSAPPPSDEEDKGGEGESAPPQENGNGAGQDSTDASRKSLADSLKAMRNGGHAGNLLKRGFVAQKNNQRLAQNNAREQRSGIRPAQASAGRNDFVRGHTLEQIRADVKNYVSRSTTSSHLMDRLEAMSKHCLYPADLFDFSGFVRDGASGLAAGDLQPWNSLAKQTKKQILDKLMAMVWVPVLVHELGHNMGLRHNFAGSEDKDNFYDRAELDQLNVKSTIPYSSVMDYPRSNINALPTLGKYDIAALRFGYLRQVETTEGSLVRVDETLQALLEGKIEGKGNNDNGVGTVSLKKFEFCTDEQVGPNAGCKRHDEGTTLEEITDVLIRDFYQAQYKFRNFRNGRADFSLTRDKNYAAYIDYIFGGLRAMYETVESIRNRYQLADDANEWKTDSFLLNIKNAADKAAEFFVDVLREPDVVCLIGEAKDPSRLLGVEPLVNFGHPEVPLGCWDVELDAKFVMVGQAGKSFRSRKDPTSTNSYADQIDVRGIWIDKLLALKALVGRYTGMPSFDEYTENMLTMPGVGRAVAVTIAGIVNDRLGGDVIFSTPKGEKLVLETKYDLSPTHMIDAPIDTTLLKPFGLNEKGETFFVEAMMRILVRELPSTIHKEAGDRFLELLQVYRELPANGRPLKSYTFADVGTQRFLALPQNLIAADIIARLNAVQVLDKLEITKVAAIAAAVKAGEKLPAGAKAEERAAAAVSIELLQAYVKNLLMSESDYARILSQLPVAK